MGYIFEAEIDSIIHAVRIKTIGEDDGIYLKKIISANIHPAVKAYFKAEVEKMLVRERASEHRSKKFSYSLPEIRSLENQIDLLLVHNYHFSSQEFDSLLDESVHFQFNYLCRPQWTLLNFIIGEQRRVASAMIEIRLKYCVDYVYFPELIKRYIADHGLVEVTYEEFKSLVERIDCGVVAQHSSRELANITRALFDFVEAGKMTPQVEFEQQTLPINAAIVFFEDKGMKDIRVRLELERDRNSIAQITADRLAEIIEAVRTGNEEPIMRPAAIPVIPQDEMQQTHIQEVESQPLGMQEDSEQVPEMNPVVQPEVISLPHPPPLVFGEDDEKYLASTPSMKQKEIIDLFSEEEQKLLVNKLFNKEENVFRGAVIEISFLHSWENAAQYLDKLFVANEADPFSAEAVLFTDKLFAHFHPPDTVK